MEETKQIEIHVKLSKLQREALKVLLDNKYTAVGFGG